MGQGGLKGVLCPFAHGVLMPPCRDSLSEGRKKWEDQKLNYLTSMRKYQPSSAGGTRSPPAMPHRLQNPKWPPGAPKMADVVWNGV